MAKAITKAVITAAGFGSRFLPITKTVPKELLPIIDKPIIQYLVEECAQAGIEEVIIVASAAEITKFEDYFYGRSTNIRSLMSRQGKLDRWKKVEKIFHLPKITVVPQDERLPYGNGSPVLSIKDLVNGDDAFIVMFGDDMFLSEVAGVKQLIDYYQQNLCDVLLGVVQAPKSLLTQGAVVKIKEGTVNQVGSMKEKPTLEELENDPTFTDLYSIGRFVATQKIFEYLTPEALGKDGELWLQDANNMIAQNDKALFYKLRGEFHTTGDPLRYMKAHIRYALEREEISEELKDYLKKLEI